MRHEEARTTDGITDYSMAKRGLMPSEEALLKSTGPAKVVDAGSSGSAIGCEFYNGMEWLAAWLVDHAEGETVTEELARQWAVEAWQEHVRRQGPNDSR